MNISIVMLYFVLRRVDLTCFCFSGECSRPRRGCCSPVGGEFCVLLLVVGSAVHCCVIETVSDVSTAFDLMLMLLLVYSGQSNDRITL
jgi:hypothetical protein